MAYAQYPGTQAEIVSLAEIKSYCNISSSDYDSFITSYIPIVRDQIETYCDRRFLKWTWQEWFPYNRSIMLPQYPVNTIMFMGTPVMAVNVVDPDSKYSFDIKQTNGVNPSIMPKLTVIDTQAFTTQDYDFSDYTTVAALIAQVNIDYPNLVFTVSTSPSYDFNNMNTLSLRAGTGLNWYGALRQDVLYKIDDATNRNLLVPENVTLSFNALDYWFETALNIVWDAGYTQAQVPGTLKMVVCSIFRDIMSIYDVDGSGTYRGIYNSETLGDYSYSIGNFSKIGELVTQKYASMLQPYKKLIC